MKQLVSIGESTWMMPMICSLLHSGAHMALRMPWKRMESPAPKRGSICASEVRMETRSFSTRSAIVLEMVILPWSPPAARCFTTMGVSRSPPSSSRSIRNPRSAGTWSNTISMMRWSTSSTERASFRSFAKSSRTFRMRLSLAISWTSGAFFASAIAEASGSTDGASSFERSLTLRTMVPLSSESAWSSESSTLPSRLRPKVIWNLPSRMRSPSCSTASMTVVPLTEVPFFDLRSWMRTPSSSTTMRACCREMPKSLSTTWHSGERPMTTSPEEKVWVWGASPS